WERAYNALRSVEDARMREVARSTQSSSAAASAAADVERVSDAAKRVAAEIEATEAAVKQCRTRQAQIAAEMEKFNAQSEQLSAAQRRAESEASAAVTTVDERRSGRETAHARCTQLSARRDALKQFETGSAGAPAGSRELLDAAKSGKLGGVIGTIASQIKVKDRYAIAIDAALGVHAHDVIVRTLTDAKAAMQLLKSKQVGRATVIALEALPSKR